MRHVATKVKDLLTKQLHITTITTTRQNFGRALTNHANALNFKANEVQSGTTRGNTNSNNNNMQTRHSTAEAAVGPRRQLRYGYGRMMFSKCAKNAAQIKLTLTMMTLMLTQRRWKC